MLDPSEGTDCVVVLQHQYDLSDVGKVYVQLHYSQCAFICCVGCALRQTQGSTGGMSDRQVKHHISVNFTLTDGMMTMRERDMSIMTTVYSRLTCR